MKITGQLTWQDYLQAQYLHARLVWWGQLIVVLAILAFIGGYTSTMIPDIAAQGWGVLGYYLWLPLVIVVALLLYYFVALPRRVRRLYQQHTEMQSPFEHEITESGLASSNEFAHADRPWGHFRKWKQDKNILLLYVSDIQFVLIPKRFCTAEQLEALRGHLAQNHIPEVGIVTRRSVITTGVLIFWLIVGGVIYLFTARP